MSSMLPMGVDLLDRVDDELQKRGVELTPKARDAIEREFTRRLKASPDSDATLRAWEANLSNYVGALDRIARARRHALRQPEGSKVTLDSADVHPSFALCSKLCPGPV